MNNTCLSCEVNRFKGFTVVEMLVAISILSVLMIMLSEIMLISAQTVGHTVSTIDSVGECRLVLDRFGNDWDNRIRRIDSPFTVIKNAGNDSISFYSTVNGFSVGNSRTRVSQVDYLESPSTPFNYLSRGVLNLSWSSGTPLQLGSGTALSLISTQPGGSNDYQLLSDDVCRFEICFILKSTGQISANQPANLSDLGAVVVSVAALDRTTRQKLTATQVTQLTSALADAASGTSIAPLTTPADTWNNYLASSQAQTLSKAILENIQIAQRIYYAQ